MTCRTARNLELYPKTTRDLKSAEFRAAVIRVDPTAIEAIKCAIEDAFTALDATFDLGGILIMEHIIDDWTGLVVDVTKDRRED